jgi:hypothetical protein
MNVGAPLKKCRFSPSPEVPGPWIPSNAAPFPPSLCFFVQEKEKKSIEMLADRAESFIDRSGIFFVDRSAYY